MNGKLLFLNGFVNPLVLIRILQIIGRKRRFGVANTSCRQGWIKSGQLKFWHGKFAIPTGSDSMQELQLSFFSIQITSVSRLILGIHKLSRTAGGASSGRRKVRKSSCARTSVLQCLTERLLICFNILNRVSA